MARTIRAGLVDMGNHTRTTHTAWTKRKEAPQMRKKTTLLEKLGMLAETILLLLLTAGGSRWI